MIPIAIIKRHKSHIYLSTKLILRLSGRFPNASYITYGNSLWQTFPSFFFSKETSSTFTFSPQSFSTNNASISALNTFLDIGPINAVSTSPRSDNSAKWGMASTPNSWINGQFLPSSPLTRMKLTRSPYSCSIDWRVGAATLQFSHHGALLPS